MTNGPRGERDASGRSYGKSAAEGCLPPEVREPDRAFEEEKSVCREREVVGDDHGSPRHPDCAECRGTRALGHQATSADRRGRGSVWPVTDSFRISAGSGGGPPGNATAPAAPRGAPRGERGADTPPG